MPIAIAVHALAAAVWVGGLFFAYTALRPSVGALEPPDRCRLWHAVLGRFFRVVWLCVAALLATGYWMALVALGGMGAVGVHVHLMQGLGILMMLLFLHVWFGPFAKLGRAVEAGDWPGAAAQIGRIRKVVIVNMPIGLVVIAIGAGGRWL